MSIAERPTLHDTFADDPMLASMREADDQMEAEQETAKQEIPFDSPLNPYMD
ncbi:hypothetical protein [Effusibacillus pohliae]|uniref:hypothetical protein n=1 Tax=Effusibacillus pohliae TaxID=232270 RepID=UPI000373608D|nr:hypothetical protein [Effusibacillus pohliae]